MERSNKYCNCLLIYQIHNTDIHVDVIVYDYDVLVKTVTKKNINLYMTS